MADDRDALIASQQAEIEFLRKQLALLIERSVPARPVMVPRLVPDGEPAQRVPNNNPSRLRHRMHDQPTDAERASWTAADPAGNAPRESVEASFTSKQA